MGRLRVILPLIFLFWTIIFTIYSIYWINHSTIENNKSYEYYVSRGTSFSKIVYDLSKSNVISHPKLFILYANILKKTNQIKYGTYKFSDTDSPKRILEKLVLGETIVIKVTIPEGLNIFQIAQRLEKYFPTVSQREWINYFSTPSIIKTLGLNSDVKNLEGFLYPQTYFFDPHPEPLFITKAFVAEFKKNVPLEVLSKAKAMGLTPLQFITFASIVEKETALPSERNLVSAVYWNRLKKRMKLQADPTVMYGVLNKNLSLQQNELTLQKHSLTKKELLTPTSYNTYYFAGLPIGPIANPGISSILATLNPAKSDALYFVATGQGGHTFSKTLEEHNKAVRKYLRYLKQEKKKNEKLL